MKKLFLAMTLFLLVMPIVMSEKECNTREDLKADNLEARYLFYHWRAEQRRVAMDAIIGLYEENAIDTSELKSIKDEFVALYDEAKEAADNADREAFNDAIEKGKELIADFKEKSREQNITGVREAINSALEENEEYLDGLHDGAIDARRGTYVKAFEARICHFENVFERLEEEEIDITDLQEELDAIEAKMDDLEEKVDAADEACDVPIARCTEEEAEQVKALKKEIIEDFKTLNSNIREVWKSHRNEKASERLQDWVDRQKDNIEKAQDRIDRLENGNISISDLQSQLDDIESLNKEAQTALDDNDADTAKEKLNEAKEKLAKLAEDIREAVSE